MSMFTRKNIYLLVVSLFLTFSCSDDTSYIVNNTSVPSSARTKGVDSNGTDVPDKLAEQEQAERAGNHPPVIEKAKLVLGTAKGKDYLKVETSVSDPDNDDVELEFIWYKNGESIDVTGDTMTDFIRGDVIKVDVRPYDGFAYGNDMRTQEMEINNTSPTIIEHSDVMFDGKIYKYGVKAVDKDGDTLKYRLKKSPKGMVIDTKSGMVTWEVPVDFTGNADASVMVSDGHSGSVQYDFTATISEAASEK